MAQPPGNARLPTGPSKPRDLQAVHIINGVTFSHKEHRILLRLVQGDRNKDIALVLGTTENVIKNYLRVIMDKSGMENRLELALWYIYHTKSNGAPQTP